MDRGSCGKAVIVITVSIGTWSHADILMDLQMAVLWSLFASVMKKLHSFLVTGPCAKKRGSLLHLSLFCAGWNSCYNMMN